MSCYNRLNGTYVSDDPWLLTSVLSDRWGFGGVVLSNGAVVTLPFVDYVTAIAETWLLDQTGGSAIADILTGSANPSGRLGETISQRSEDNPTFGNLPDDNGHVRYGAVILVGYRWYDAKQLPVTYSFGHGLSYTTFSYDSLEVSVPDSAAMDVTVRITNTGNRDGREVMQIYVHPETSTVLRPPREPKAFLSIEIPAGQTVTVQMRIPLEDLAYWDIRFDDYALEGGDYVVEAGSPPITLNSRLIDVLADPVVGPILREILGTSRPGRRPTR